MLAFLALVFGDLLMGAARALKMGTFRPQRVADIFITKTMPFGITFLVLAAMSAAAAGTAYDTIITGAFWAAGSAMCLGLLGSILENVNAITGSAVKLPEPASS